MANKAKRGWTLREYKRVLKNNGFIYNRTSGDHEIWINSEGRHISFQYHPNDMVYNRLLKENGIKV